MKKIYKNKMYLLQPKSITYYLLPIIYYLLPITLLSPITLFAADCGPGYVFAKAAQKIDGIEAFECQKLWCMDLENGRTMGAGDKANQGYVATKQPVELGEIECWGDRKWCKGETSGVWNSEYGVYTKHGDDSNAFLSIQRGDCWSWKTEKPDCLESDKGAVLVNGRWECQIVSDTGAITEAVRKSAIRRTATIKKIGK